MKKIVLLMMVCFGVLIAKDSTQKIEIGIDEKIGQTLPMNLEFFDEKGYQVTLKDIVKKPFILNFVYYRCPGICSPILTELTTIVNFHEMEIGKDYQIITISFDEREKPELAASKKENYMGLLNKKIPDESWKFLTGDSATIHTLTDAAGFMFKREGNDFLHAGTIIAVSPEGKIARYLYGTKYLPFDVKMAMTEASEGRTGPTIAKLLSYCYSYNPDGQRYVFDVTRVSGAVILFFAVVFVVYISVKPKKIQK
ncbi:MAG: SCO family protein [Ignavibacteriales bacterium]|nr:SCO family protein [Ignavibacteriales bacterium]